MTIDDKIGRAETQLFESTGLDPETSFVELPASSARLRVLSFGSGQPVLLLHGVASSAAAWTPLLGELPGFRLHVVDLPGHGLSDPVAYRRGGVRDHTLRVIDDLFEVLALEVAPVIGHSLGGLFALWHAAARPGPIRSLVVLGSPAVAIPGAVVRMPLSLMTVRWIGWAMLRGPSSRSAYRWLLGTAVGRAGAAAVPTELLDALRFAARRPDNARSVAALMHAINGFRRARPESVMTADELSRVTASTAFLWGTDDVYQAPGDARRWIARMPLATLHELPAGHAPHIEDPAGCAAVITQHLTATGFPPVVLSRVGV